MKNLSPENEKKLNDFLDCLEPEDVAKFHKLLDHAESIDRVMEVAEALGTVGKFFRTMVLWFAGLAVALVTLNAVLKDRVSGWLGLS